MTWWSVCPALLFVGSVACGSTPGVDATTQTPDVNIGACGAIGMSCGGCPNGLQCIANTCVPVHGDCGGIAGTQCQDTSLVCTYPTGNTAGICMQPDEKACLCAIAPDALQDCTQVRTPPTRKRSQR